MNKPSPRSLGVEWARRRGTNDSSSEYSGERRLSYINGAETDEEEGHTEAEVMGWTPDRVAEYLEDIGVEKQHCDVFREQEFSGEVILGMDQSSIFLKELELGPIGRRLKTWQKIKALQEEVRNAQFSPKSRGSNASTPNIGRGVSSGTPVLPRISQASNETSSPRDSGFSAPSRSQTMPPGMDSFLPLAAVATSVRQHSPRPSAASIREMGHARRQSSIDLNYADSQSIVASRRQSTVDQGYPVPITTNGLAPLHSKQPSFDRSWTMGSTTGRVPSSASRPQSVVHMYSMSSDRAQFEKPIDSITAPKEDLDRGYISGGELDIKRQRNTVRKNLSVEHNAQPSYGADNKRRSFFRGGAKPQDSVKPGEATSPDAVAGSQAPLKISRIVSEPVMERAPIVTKLEQGRSGLPEQPTLQTGESLDDRAESSSRASSPASAPPGNLRAVSDAVTGRERALAVAPVEGLGSAEKSVPHSPSQVSLSTPSATSKSFETDDGSQKQMVGPGVARMGPRSKKTTSAYLRGLEKKSPREQMVDCDYSGWMKKKSSNLMTTWKPRLFVLRGRRLSYYYSENDTEEKGLIDISNHRVLPAGNERITGLHAALTGATSSPASPQIHNSSFSPHSSANGGQTPPGISPISPAFSYPTHFPKDGGNQTFIFKLVPPRTGLSRAVNFTKPTVHYFAVSSLNEGRLWMAAMMKATIDRDESAEVKTTYQQKTISLASARARKERPPALRGVTEDGSAPATSGAQEEPISNNKDNAGDEPVSPVATPTYSTDLATVPEAVSPVSHGLQSPNLQPTALVTNASEQPTGRDVTILEIGRSSHNDGSNQDLQKVTTSASVKSSGSWGASSLRKSGSTTQAANASRGLGISNGSSPTSPVIGRMQNAGLW